MPRTPAGAAVKSLIAGRRAARRSSPLGRSARSGPARQLRSSGPGRSEPGGTGPGLDRALPGCICRSSCQRIAQYQLECIQWRPYERLSPPPTFGTPEPGSILPRGGGERVRSAAARRALLRSSRPFRGASSAAGAFSAVGGRLNDRKTTGRGRAAPGRHTEHPVIGRQRPARRHRRWPARSGVSTTAGRRISGTRGAACRGTRPAAERRAGPVPDAAGFRHVGHPSDERGVFAESSSRAAPCSGAP